MQLTRVCKVVLFAFLIVISGTYSKGEDDDDESTLEQNDNDDFTEYEESENDTSDTNETSVEEEEEIYDDNGILMTSEHSFK
jgi:hypothetical protein